MYAINLMITFQWLMLQPGQESRTIEVVREPYIAKVTPDGSILTVANSLPLGKSTDTAKIACEISIN